MKVKDLIEVLSGFDGNAEVVQGSGDHRYLRVRGARRNQAEKHPNGYLSEFYDAKQLAKGAQVVDVVVLA